MPRSGQLLRAVDELVDRIRVGAVVLVGPHREGAEPAPHHADIGRVEVRVDVVRHLVAVHPAGHGVGGGPQVFERRVPIQGDGLVGRDSFAVSGAGKDGIDHARHVSKRLRPPVTQTAHRDVSVDPDFPTPWRDVDPAC